MSRLVFLISAFVCLIGCAARYNQHMTRMMEPFMGKPITEVTEAWGPPTTVYDEPPYKVYVWHSNRTYGGGSHPQSRYNYGTGKWESQQVSVPVRTENTYREYWVDSDGNCVKYKFGSQ
jgi:hypothetical protein